MTSKFSRGIGTAVLCAGFLVAFAAGAASLPGVQTNTATNVQNTQATLQGYLSDLGGYGSATVWFQYGLTSSYGYQTAQMSQSYQSSFTQTIYSLAANSTYHFRAVAQNQYGISYGQDMTFYTGSGGNSQIVVNAGPDLYVSQGQSAVLQGSGYDTQGNPVNYSWNCTGGSLSSYTVLQPTYTAPYNSYNQTYTCTLTVSNNYGASNSDSAIMYVNYGNGNLAVQTNSASNISNSQATLNGYVSGGSYNTSVWFQWGTSSSYSYTTNTQQMNGSGSFNQNIASLSSGTTYHYRAVAQNSNGQIMYGQDMTFVANGGNYGYGQISLQKQVINLSSGNLNWSQSVYASTNDIVEFSLTVQNTGSQDLQNVVVRDQLPGGLPLIGSATVSGNSNYSGNNIASGITFNDIPAGQTATITYEAQVTSGAGSTLTNSATATSSQGNSQSASASVVVQGSILPVATSVSTGIGNGPFALPLLLTLAAGIIASYILKLRKMHRHGLKKTAAQ